MQKEDFEDDPHVFRRPVNDITSQLDINFGSLPRPGRGSRGARGGRGRGRRVEETGPRPEVVVLGSTFSLLFALEFFFVIVGALGVYCSLLCETSDFCSYRLVSNSCLIVSWPGYFELLTHIMFLKYWFRLTVLAI